MGFAQGWVCWIMSCITSVSYAIVTNGQIGQKFIPSRGLRQGDPLSTLLFLVCSEGLSALLRMGAHRGIIQGMKICRGAPTLTHLFFADDSVIFGEAATNGAHKLLDILSTYSQCSGHVINYDKSSVFFSTNVIKENRREVCRLLQVTAQQSLDKYLGLPSMVGRNKKE
ncbi:hypothetical protein HRI_002554800 [Hibiscus trionum]|uniref:Reverse transcriptase domain-containing protein n=1 Tax=Hibiscus trionum TaxID=183268 RepID=A0A9W7I7A1_HIBTR|nr:hypothetical protein HRI_002554800 [Hibiscus trionum]